MDNLKSELNKKLEGIRQHFISELSTVRSSGASSTLLDRVSVEVYGQRMPIAQVATISIPEPNQLLIKPWDRCNASVIEKAIGVADLGVSITNEGEQIRVILPPLSNERREELVKLVNKMTEEAKISVRNIRRDILEEMEKLADNGGVSDDDKDRFKKDCQTIIDKMISEIDVLSDKKSTDLRSI